jgi:peptidoglycan hydrolase CwlO-like protein
VLKDREISELTDKIDALKKATKGEKDKFKKIQLKVSELQNQVNELKNHIDRLKSVDIRIEEKKRKNGSQ